MKIIEFDKDNRFWKEEGQKEKVIALGKFIGFHKGHQKIFKKAKEIALKDNKELIIMLYPDHDYSSNLPQKNILPFETRLTLIKQYNPDYILIFKPTKENYQVTREEFFVYLEKVFKVTDVVIGKNFSFNKKDGKDDFLLLGERFNLNILPLEKYKGQIISTNLLNFLISEGRLEEFKNLTNFNYFYQGKVVPGKMIGSKYNTPTANVSVYPTLLNPREGIYASYITVDGLKYYSVTSISNNPTFNQKYLYYETFILKFDRNIYGKEVTVELLKFMREPKKFMSIKSLYNEIELDKKKTKEYFNL